MRHFLSVTLSSVLAAFPALCANPPVAPPRAAASAQEIVVETVFDGGIKGKWQDWGWAPRDVEVGKPARLNFANNAGWILAHRGLTGHFSTLTFRVLAPAKFGDFLEVRVSSDSDDTFPRVQVAAEHRHAADGGWTEVRIPMAKLNPPGQPFDRVVLRASRGVDSSWVEVDKIALLGAADGSTAVGTVSLNYPTHRVSMQIDCTKTTRSINPLIYGIAFSPRKNVTDKFQWQVGATARRWGGNPASRYNWKLGNAWNTALDWYFMNVNYTNINNYSWEMFLDENRTHNVGTALTVPTMGWVAKDTKSYSYPVSIYGPQRARFGQNQDIGNGITPTGAKIAECDPTRTSQPAAPEFVGDWVKAIRAYDETHRGRSVNMYYLDNEPALWNSTHRDVHPQPLTYDELLRRTIDYARQIRRNDPQAVIAGPAEWGWPAYFFSAADAAAGFSKKPDRKAHGDTPLLAWYLQQLKSHEDRTGERLLNVLDVHYYPQSDGIYGGHERTDAATAERRIRATRSLWDPTYKDESWINDTIRLLPRLRALVAENYPGLEIGIGEYNFGGEKHMSGGLALAEVLGRFGQEGVGSAFYWTYPSENSCAYNAFRAYRNYDGQGAHFLSRSIPTTGDKQTSLFASQDESGTSMVAIVLNMDPREGADTSIELAGCGDVTSGRMFQYTGGSEGIRPVTDKLTTEGRATVHQKLPPYSISIIDMKVDKNRKY